MVGSWGGMTVSNLTTFLIKLFHPIGDGSDGRSQAEELDDTDLDRLSWGKLNDGPLLQLWCESHPSLSPGRLLALDLLLLEALLIVDEQPRGCPPHSMGHGS